MNLRTLLPKRLRGSTLILLSLCVFALVLSGCCGACGDFAEGFKEGFNEAKNQPNEDNTDEPVAERSDDDDDSNDSDNAGPAKNPNEQDAPTEDVPSNTPSVEPRSVKELRGSDLEAFVKSQGWKLLDKPQTTEKPYKSTLLTIIKPPMGGAIGLYEYKQVLAAKTFAKGMKDQKAAVARSGKKVLTVHIPNHQDEARKLMRLLVVDP